MQKKKSNYNTPSLLIDFSEQREVLQQLHRLILTTKSPTNDNAKSKEDSQSTLSLDSQSSSLTSPLSQQTHIRRGLKQIDQLASSYHVTAQKIVNELFDENQKLKERNKKLERELKRQGRYNNV